MQRPRRTSEFNEENGTAKKIRPSARSASAQRHTSAPSPATATVGGVVGGGGGTARNHASRQSRIALPTARSSSSTRVSSLDRAAGPSLGLPSTSVSRSVRPHSPQSTPLHVKEPRRILFTAEKQKAGAVGGGGGGGAHNDKKWVQEQTQRINTYLSEMTPLGAGIEGADFFVRGVRQMTIKQFIAIINYFLSFITRFVVKNNSFVDDIVSVLHKLRYPYQVNKSWLKTPTTQQSFGNVIVLFDFLMDFVPEAMPSTSSVADFLVLPLQVPQNPPIFASHIEEQLPLQIPDTEYQVQLLLNSEDGFLLWDNNRMDDFKRLQQQTCDVLIKKYSGVDGLAAMDEEMLQLRVALDDLVRQRPPMPIEDEAKCRHQEEILNKLTQRLQTLNDDHEVKAKQMKQLERQCDVSTEKIKRMKEEVAQTKAIIGAQLCSVAKRNELIDEAAQLSHDLECHQRTLHDLQQRSYQQQVSLSRAKKQLTDQVEKFNVHMHDIVYSGMYTGSQDLQLRVQPSSVKDLEYVVATLTALRHSTQAELQQNTEAQQKYELQIAEIKDQIHAAIEPKINEITAALSAAQNRKLDTANAIDKERHTFDTQQRQLEAESQQLQTETSQIEQMIAKRQEVLLRWKMENEEYMLRLEQVFNAYAEKRDEHLKNYAIELDNAEKRIKLWQQQLDKKE